MKLNIVIFYYILYRQKVMKVNGNHTEAQGIATIDTKQYKWA